MSELPETSQDSQIFDTWQRYEQAFGIYHKIDIVQEQGNTTPPPSPFASCFQGSDSGEGGGPNRDNQCVDVSDGNLLANRSRSSVSRILNQLRGFPGEAKSSPSKSPDTPSAVGGKQMMALSRNSSLMSDPLLAELLQCKLLSCKGQASLEEQLGLFQPK